MIYYDFETVEELNQFLKALRLLLVNGNDLWNALTRREFPSASLLEHVSSIVITKEKVEFSVEQGDKTLRFQSRVEQGWLRLRLMTR